MKLYKILFENNQPVSAVAMDQILNKSMEIEFIEGRRVVKSITIYADDEQDGLETASGIVASMPCFL